MPYKIGLDIGHGENTWEKTGGKGIKDDPTTPQKGDHWEEFWFNEAVGKLTYYRLKEHGFDVVLPQKWDANEVSLKYRSDMFNRNNTDLNVSIHANAGPVSAKGACIFYWPGSRGEDFADIWIKNFKALCPEQGLHGNGKHAVVVGTWTNLHMVRETKAVTNLIEHGFFTNPEQLKNLKNPDFQERCAEAIVKSVCEYFGVKYKKKVKQVEKKPDYIGSRYEKEIQFVKDKGIFKGYPDGNFGVGEPLTREHMAVIIARMFQKGYLK